MQLKPLKLHIYRGTEGKPIFIIEQNVLFNEWADAIEHVHSKEFHLMENE